MVNWKCIEYTQFIEYPSLVTGYTVGYQSFTLMVMQLTGRGGLMPLSSTISNIPNQGNYRSSKFRIWEMVCTEFILFLYYGKVKKKKKCKWKKPQVRNCLYCTKKVYILGKIYQCNHRVTLDQIFACCLFNASSVPSTLRHCCPAESSALREMF